MVNCSFSLCRSKARGAFLQMSLVLRAAFFLCLPLTSFVGLPRQLSLPRNDIKYIFTEVFYEKDEKNFVGNFSKLDGRLLRPRRSVR